MEHGVWGPVLKSPKQVSGKAPKAGWFQQPTHLPKGTAYLSSHFKPDCSPELKCSIHAKEPTNAQ